MAGASAAAVEIKSIRRRQRALDDGGGGSAAAWWSRARRARAIGSRTRRRPIFISGRRSVGAPNAAQSTAVRRCTFSGLFQHIKLATVLLKGCIFIRKIAKIAAAAHQVSVRHTFLQHHLAFRPSVYIPTRSACISQHPSFRILISRENPRRSALEFRLFSAIYV